MKLTTILLFVPLIFIFSCQKEARPDTITPPPTPLSDDSIYLSQYIIIDTTLATKDTLLNMKFYYDGAKRNTGIDYIEYESNIPVKVFKSNFEYKAADTFPSKKTINSFDLPAYTINENDLNEASYFTYSNGELFVDSTVPNNLLNRRVGVYKYKYYQDSIVTNTIVYDYTSNNIYTYAPEATLIKIINGNIVEQKDTSEPTTQKFNFTYDTHPNPFYRTQSKFCLENRFPFYYMETFVEEVFATNNAVDINQNEIYSQLTNYNFHFKNVYQYKANGYPSVQWSTDQNAPENSFKAIYLYTN